MSQIPTHLLLGLSEEQMLVKLQVAGQSDTGQVRSINEDRFYFRYVQASDEEPAGVFIVADGLGGYLAGEVASHWAVETVKRGMAKIFLPDDEGATKRVRPQELWSPPDAPNPTANMQMVNAETVHLMGYAIKKANEVLLSYSQQKPDEAGGMGSTIVVLVIQDGLATIANLGDSRGYLWRKGELRQITTDHTLPGELAARGQLPPDRISTHPQRHILQRCLGRHPLVEPDIFRPIKLECGDKFLLCSDGLWNMVTPADRIADVLARSATMDDMASHLITMANDAGGDDNITALLVSIESAV